MPVANLNLFKAIVAKDFQAAEAALNDGAVVDFITPHPRFGLTCPLFETVRNNCPEIFALLLERGADINIEVDGKTISGFVQEILTQYKGDEEKEKPFRFFLNALATSIIENEQITTQNLRALRETVRRQAPRCAGILYPLLCRRVQENPVPVTVAPAKAPTGILARFFRSKKGLGGGP